MLTVTTKMLQITLLQFLVPHVPNSETRHAELFVKFESRFAEYDHVM